MKITVNITLAGYAFHVDEDAYQQLRQYLIRLEKAFSEENGSAEIIADIESRMADLFTMRLNKFKQVITITDLDEVIAVLGSPEAISGNGADSGATGHRASSRFYRDGDGRMFGGVCAGMAAYFSLNPLLFRILFIALSLIGGFGLALYLVLWAVIPEAKTTMQKLEMRGDPITIANITRMVKEQFKTVKKKMNL